MYLEGDVVEFSAVAERGSAGVHHSVGLGQDFLTLLFVAAARR